MNTIINKKKKEMMDLFLKMDDEMWNDETYANSFLYGNVDYIDYYNGSTSHLQTPLFLQHPF